MGGYGTPGPAPIVPAGGGPGTLSGAGPIGKERNPVMVLVIGMLCFVYAIIQLIQMLSELKAFRQKDDISIITFFIPILNLIKMWQLPEKVLEAKRMAGIPNPQTVHPIGYIFLSPFFLSGDLNEIWAAARNRPSLPPR
jgi:hypothetical protein